MGLGAISVGMMFLFNPTIHVIDILPDCVGYFLIYMGLFRMSFRLEKLAEARKNFLKLIWITGLRAVSIVLLPYTDEVMPLLLSFSFTVLEAIYFIPAILYLFDGLFALGSRMNTESVYDIRNHRYHFGWRAGTTAVFEHASRLKRNTIRFFGVHACANVLPELTALESRNSMGTGTAGMTLSAFQPMFYLFGCAISAVCGIFWLISMLRYLQKLKKDEILVSGINQFFQEKYLSNESLQIFYRMKKVLILISVSAFCSCMLILDGINIVPNVLAAIFALISFGLMYRYDRRVVVGMVVSVLSGAVSTVSMVIQTPYFQEYTPRSARYITGAAQKYGTVRLLGTLEYLCLAGMFVFLFLAFMRVLKKHAQINRMGMNHGERSLQGTERYGYCRNSLWISLGGSVAHCAINAAYYTAAMYMDYFLVVNSIFSLVWVAAVIYAMKEAYENVYEPLSE